MAAATKKADPSARTFGFELEYASNSLATLDHLRGLGLATCDTLHRYHCDCEHCAVIPGEQYRPRADRYVTVTKPPDLHAQTDSTADGEFITRVLSDWGDFQRIAEGLTASATLAGATTSARCGLHVHVGTQDMDMDTYRLRRVAIAYLAFERFFTEIIAPGRAQQKRDMNTTLMQSLRQYVVDGYSSGEPEFWKSISRTSLCDLLMTVIGRDRHVDLNFSQRARTWEFRVFNATNATWRIELAARMSVAFVAASEQLVALVESTLRGDPGWPVGCDSPWGEIARPAWSTLPAPHPTKRPIVPMDQFVAVLCGVDPALEPLIARQRSYMRARYAKMIA